MLLKTRAGETSCVNDWVPSSHRAAQDAMVHWPMNKGMRGELPQFGNLFHPAAGFSEGFRRPADGNCRACLQLTSSTLQSLVGAAWPFSCLLLIRLFQVAPSSRCAGSDEAQDLVGCCINRISRSCLVRRGRILFQMGPFLERS
jgi:hypothetical protein